MEGKNSGISPGAQSQEIPCPRAPAPVVMPLGMNLPKSAEKQRRS